MQSEQFFVPLEQTKPQITLDGLPVEIPLRHRSLKAIRAHLEILALAQNRILVSFNVDGNRTTPVQSEDKDGIFCRIVAESICFDQTPALILTAALHQTEHALARVESALTLVLINEGSVARELWWTLVTELKQPVLTLSFLPADALIAAEGCAPISKLRQWQFEQVTTLIRQVDEACHAQDAIRLSNALESRVLPWLNNLRDLINLWRETVMAKSRLAGGYWN
jgi:hypothetical protein